MKLPSEILWLSRMLSMRLARKRRPSIYQNISRCETVTQYDTFVGEIYLMFYEGNLINEKRIFSSKVNKPSHATNTLLRLCTHHMD